MDIGEDKFIISATSSNTRCGFLGEDGVGVVLEDDAKIVTTAEEIGDLIIKHRRICLERGMENPRYLIERLVE